MAAEVQGNRRWVEAASSQGVDGQSVPIQISLEIKSAVHVPLSWRNLSGTYIDRNWAA